MVLKHVIKHFILNCERVALVDGDRVIREDIVCYLGHKPILVVLDGNVERYEHVPLHELDKILAEYEMEHNIIVQSEDTENTEESPEE